MYACENSKPRGLEERTRLESSEIVRTTVVYLCVFVSFACSRPPHSRSRERGVSGVRPRPDQRASSFPQGLLLGAPLPFPRRGDERKVGGHGSHASAILPTCFCSTCTFNSIEPPFRSPDCRGTSRQQSVPVSCSAKKQHALTKSCTLSHNTVIS